MLKTRRDQGQTHGKQQECPMRMSSEIGQQGAGTEGGPGFGPSPDRVPVVEAQGEHTSTSPVCPGTASLVGQLWISLPKGSVLVHRTVIQRGADKARVRATSGNRQRSAAVTVIPHGRSRSTHELDPSASPLPVKPPGLTLGSPLEILSKPNLTPISTCPPPPHPLLPHTTAVCSSFLLPTS